MADHLKLKITGVEKITVRVPFTPRNLFWCAREQYMWDISEIIRLTTDAPGLVGYGETISPQGKGTDVGAERVKGQNPAHFLGDDSLGAGVQMAIYDLVAKALEVPVYKLFNLPRVREWCPLAWWNVDMSPEDYAAEAGAAATAGYTSHKIKGRPWWDLYAQVEAIRTAAPANYHIDIDWNQMLVNSGNAAPILARLDQYELVSLYESPIFQRDIVGLCQLRGKTSRPIALHFGIPPFPSAIAGGACDGFVIGGGVTSTLEQGALAAAFDKPCFLQMVGLGLTTAMTLHLGAVLPMAQWPAITCLNIYSDDLLAQPIEVRGGYARLPEGPGLGVEIDEEALARYKMEPPYTYPRIRQLLRVQWPDGRQRYYDRIEALWQDALRGNLPTHEVGSRLVPIPNDGTREWQDLFAQAEQGPVFSKGSG